MFFVFGISPCREQLPFEQQGICPVCGRLTRFEIWVTASCLTLFFLPVFRFGKRYYLVSSCCGASSELDAGLGRAAARGELDAVEPLNFSFGAPRQRACPACGFPADPGFAFCPKCGTRL